VNVQSVSQPSPLTALPSSHCSAASRMPLPQRGRVQLFERNAPRGGFVTKLDRLYVTTAAGHLYAVDTATGGVRWHVVLPGTAKGGASYVPEEDALIVGASVGTRRATRGTVRAIRASDGAELWSVATDLGDMRASPTVVAAAAPSAGHAAWMACGRREICAFSTRDGEVLDRLSLPSTFTGTPTLYEGRMYITLFDGGLLAFAPRGAHGARP